MSARKAKPSVAPIDNRSRLIDALSFLAIADTGKDVDKFAYVNFTNGYATAYNDCFAVGTPVDTELNLCVHGEKLKAALQHCGENFQLTQLDGSSISIKTDKSKAIIPCIDATLLPTFIPDPPCGTIGDSIKDGFSLLHKLITEKADQVMYHGLQLGDRSSVATNGHILLEHYHGHNLPPGLIIPKLTVATVAKIKPLLTNFGFSQSSFTFYFTDGSYLRSTLIDGTYPDVSRLWPAQLKLEPMPPEFFRGLDAIDKFVDADHIYFTKGHVTTHPSLVVGANYRVDGLPNGHGFSAQGWKFIRDVASAVMWASDLSKPTCFSNGALVRGLIMCKSG